MMVESSVPAIYGSDVICAYSSGDVLSLNASTGLNNWEEVLLSSNTSESGFVMSHVAASPVVYGNTVLVATSESKIELIEAVGGVRVWEQDFGTIITPIIVGKFAFVMATDGNLVCLSMEDGSIKWKTNIKKVVKEQFRLEYSMVGTLLVNGNIAVFNSVGDFAQFDPSTGSLKDLKRFGRIYTSKTPMIVDETMYLITNRASICN